MTKVLAILQQAGIKYYLVGGYVRDQLLGRVSNDLDLVVEAPLEDVFPLLPGPKQFVQGSLIRVPAERLEISRLKGALAADLASRDFAMNGMAQTAEGGIVDPLGGQRDCQQGIVRLIGEENLRADYARALKGIRQAVELDFRIEPKTWHWFQQNAQLAQQIAPERIMLELNKMLLLPEPSKAIELMRQAGILAWVMPELERLYGREHNNPHHRFDIYWHTLHALDNTDISGLADHEALILRLAALAHDWGKYEVQTVHPKTGYYRFIGHDRAGARLVRPFLKRLTYGQQLSRQVEVLIAEHMKQFDLLHMSAYKVRKFLVRMQGVNLELLYRLFFADATAKGQVDLAEVRARMEQIRRRLAHERITDLAITGADIIAHSEFRGPEVGRIKAQLQDLVLQHPDWNEKAILLEKLKSLK